MGWPKVLLLAVLLTRGLGSHAQSSSQDVNANALSGAATRPYPALPALDGPWQLGQSSFDTTPDSQARADVVAALAAFFQAGPATGLFPPEILSVEVSGRTATAYLETAYAKEVVQEAVRLRLQFGRWQVSDRALLTRRPR